MNKQQKKNFRTKFASKITNGYLGMRANAFSDDDFSELTFPLEIPYKKAGATNEQVACIWFTFIFDPREESGCRVVLIQHYEPGTESKDIAAFSITEDVKSLLIDESELEKLIQEIVAVSRRVYKEVMEQ